MAKIDIDEENGYVTINDKDYDLYEAGISESGKFIVSLPWLDDLKTNLNILKQNDVLKDNLGARITALSDKLKTMYSKEDMDRLKRRVKTLETKNESAKKITGIVNNSVKNLGRSIDLITKQSEFLNTLYNAIKADGMLPEKVFDTGSVYRVKIGALDYVSLASDPRFNYTFRVSLAGPDESGISVDVACNDKYQLLIPPKSPLIPEKIMSYILSEYKKTFIYDFDKQKVSDKYISTLKEIKDFYNKSQELIKDAKETSR